MTGSELVREFISNICSTGYDCNKCGIIVFEPIVKYGGLHTKLKVIDKYDRKVKYDNISVLCLDGCVYDLVNGTSYNGIEDYIDMLFSVNYDVRINVDETVLSRYLARLFNSRVRKVIPLLCHKSGCGCSKELWDLAKFD